MQQATERFRTRRFREGNDADGAATRRKPAGGAPEPAPDGAGDRADGPRALAWRSRLFWRIPFAVQGVALTFDDGPDPENTLRILDILAAAGARASFFLIGERAAEMPELTAR